MDSPIAAKESFFFFGVGEKGKVEARFKQEAVEEAVLPRVSTPFGNQMV